MKRAVLIIFFVMISLIAAGCSEQSLSREEAADRGEKGFEKMKIEAALKHSEIRDGIISLDAGNERVKFMDLDADLIDGKSYLSAGFSEGLAFVIDEDKQKYYIDTEGNKVIEQVDGKELHFGDIFKDGIAKVSFEPVDLGKEEFCYIDKGGKLVEGEKLPRYESYELFYRNGSTCFYTDSEGAGLFDETGRAPITGLDFVEVTPFFENRALVVDRDGAVKLIDNEAKTIRDLSEMYPERKISSFEISSEALTLNFEDQKKAVILNLDGEEILQTDYAQLGRFQDGFAKCKLGDKFGLIDKDGAECLLSIYEEVSDPYKGSVLLKKDGEWYLAKIPVK